MIIAGWASNSKYAFLGALRASAQMVSYEIAMGFALVVVLMVSASLNMTDIVLGQGKGWFAERGLTFLSAGTGCRCCRSSSSTSSRAWPRPTARPFDVVEGESEIVAGHMVEYSGMAFAMFFLAEYANILLVSALAVGDVPRRLDARRSRSPSSACRRPSGSSHGLVLELVLAVRQDLRHRDPVPLGARDVPALPLRPDHAPRLEDLHPGHAGLAGRRRPRGSSRPGTSGNSEAGAMAQRHRSRTSCRASCSASCSRACGSPAGTSWRARSRCSSRRRRRRYRRAFAACMRCAATRTARSAASPASCARRSARRWRSRSRATCATTARAGRRATTST